MTSQNVIKEGAIVAVLYLLLMFLTLFVPIIEVVTLFLLPVPLMVFAARYGWKRAAVLFGLLALASFLFLTYFSLPLVLLTGIGGLMTGIAIHQRLTAYETWARGTVGFVIGLLLTFLAVQGLFQINIVQEINQAIQDSVAQSQKMLEDFGMAFEQEEVDVLLEQMRQIVNLLPVILVVIALVLGLVSQWIGYKVIGWLDKTTLRFPPFRQFRLPVGLVWIYFAALIVTWASGDPDSIWHIGAVNVTNLAGLLVALQGLSFLFFYVHHKGISVAVPIIAIVLTVLFPFIGLYLLRILGIIDLGFSLRNRINFDKK
ncbi:YybS family protein [Virgibacillus senegalensis]|uniref:YybS family protein n=1 Tax=Virgibacillus senegalensis TaxID=1499679 RepID=UPI00069CE335|nr:YybS family protein [Virgibacillus senegalensis]